MEPKGSLPHSQVPAFCPYSKVSVLVRDMSSCFVKMPVFTVRSCQHPAHPPRWRTTPCRLSATANSICSQLPSILEAVPPTATWGRAALWWQGPTYHGHVFLAPLISSGSDMASSFIIIGTKYTGLLHACARMPITYFMEQSPSWESNQ